MSADDATLNAITTALTSHYGPLPLSVRYAAAAEACRVVEHWAADQSATAAGIMFDYDAPPSSLFHRIAPPPDPPACATCGHPRGVHLAGVGCTDGCHGFVPAPGPRPCSCLRYLAYHEDPPLPGWVTINGVQVHRDHACRSCGHDAADHTPTGNCALCALSVTRCRGWADGDGVPSTP